MRNQTVKISLFHCSNYLSVEEINHFTKQIEDVELKSLSLPCSGKINLLYLLKAIETGSDGAILAACKFGECKFLQGNLRAQKRIEAINGLLVESGMHEDCVRFVESGNNNKSDKIIKEIVDLKNQFKTESKKVTEKV